MSVKGEGFDGFGPALQKWIENKLRRTDEALMETATETAQRGKNLVQYHIATSGTVKSGKQGRILTGDMLEAVEGEAKRISRNKASAEFGWINDRRNYFRLQDQGFEHSGGAQVEGMYALSNAGEQVLNDLKEDLKRKLKDV